MAPFTDCFLFHAEDSTCDPSRLAPISTVRFKAMAQSGWSEAKAESKARCPNATMEPLVSGPHSAALSGSRS
jgi:hypothetical protein